MHLLRPNIVIEDELRHAVRSFVDRIGHVLRLACMGAHVNVYSGERTASYGIAVIRSQVLPSSCHPRRVACTCRGGRVYAVTGNREWFAYTQGVWLAHSVAFPAMPSPMKRYLTCRQSKSMTCK